jgi:hypothetical protein
MLGFEISGTVARNLNLPFIADNGRRAMNGKI